MTGPSPDPRDHSIGGPNPRSGYRSLDRRHALAFELKPSIPHITIPSAPATIGAGSQAERTVDDVDVR